MAQENQLTTSKYGIKAIASVNELTSGDLTKNQKEKVACMGHRVFKAIQNNNLLDMNNIDHGNLMYSIKVNVIDKGLDPRKKNHVHVFPFWNPRTKKFDLEAMEGYQGVMDHCTKHNTQGIEDIEYNFSYKGDKIIKTKVGDRTILEIENDDPFADRTGEEPTGILINFYKAGCKLHKQVKFNYKALYWEALNMSLKTHSNPAKSIDDLKTMTNKKGKALWDIMSPTWKTQPEKMVLRSAIVRAVKFIPTNDSFESVAMHTPKPFFQDAERVETPQIESIDKTEAIKEAREI